MRLAGVAVQHGEPYGQGYGRPLRRRVSRSVSTESKYLISQHLSMMKFS